MNNFENTQPDDPILTAFALGEIEDENERMALQEVIEANPALAEAVEEIRSTASLLGQAFAEESKATEDTNGVLLNENIEATTSVNEKKTVRFPAWIGLAAAVAVMIGVFITLPKKETAQLMVEAPAGEEQQRTPEATLPDSYMADMDELDAIASQPALAVASSDTEVATTLTDASAYLVEESESVATESEAVATDMAYADFLTGYLLPEETHTGDLNGAEDLYASSNSFNGVTDNFTVSAEQEIDFYGGYAYSLDELGGTAGNRDSFTYSDQYNIPVDSSMHAAIRSTRGSHVSSATSNMAAPSRLRQNRMMDPNCGTISFKAGEGTGVQPQIVAAMTPRSSPLPAEESKKDNSKLSTAPVLVAGSMVSQDFQSTTGIAGQDALSMNESLSGEAPITVAEASQSRQFLGVESRLGDNSSALALGSTLETGPVVNYRGLADGNASSASEDRGQLPYGDLEEAKNTLGEAETRDPGNANAKALNVEIGQVLALAGDTRTVTREQRLQEVTKSWSRPSSFGFAPVPEPVPPPPAPGYRQQDEPSNTEGYEEITDNAFVSPVVEPLSTFSIDVDTASYANMRRFIDHGNLPPPDAVRIEELINYFPYDYKAPGPKDEHPIAIYLDAAPAPWAPEHHLVRIGLKAREVDWKDRPASNLIFLLDVSGSMNRPNKLPLVKEALGKLIRRLDKRDRVAIVVYAGASGLVLPSTTANNTETILHALDNLQAGGSTNGGQGIQLAYKTAKENFLSEGNNRIILCTDGDFNVGTTDKGQLTDVVAAEARDGVYLTVLGFGMGNLKDDMLETLSNKGNGNYGYIDSAKEARKVFVEQATGTLLTVAKDVKIQVEFNPQHVGAYRLIGYENRKLAAQDFNDDKKDAGEVGAGHTVTALYEIIPAGQKTGVPSVDPLKYQIGGRSKKEEVDASETVLGVSPVSDRADFGSELLTAKLRYKLPDSDTSTKLERPFAANAVQDSFKEASVDFRFAAAVAEFGMVLRNSPYKELSNLIQAKDTAEDALGKDPGGHRGDFVDLVEKAISITPAD